MKKCKHLWVRDGFGKLASERYYCQKCLREINVERWKDVIEITYLDLNKKLKEGDRK